MRSGSSPLPPSKQRGADSSQGGGGGSNHSALVLDPAVALRSYVMKSATPRRTVAPKASECRGRCRTCNRGGVGHAAQRTRYRRFRIFTVFVVDLAVAFRNQSTCLSAQSGDFQRVSGDCPGVWHKCGACRPKGQISVQCLCCFHPGVPVPVRTSVSARMHEELLSSDMPGNGGTRRPFRVAAGPEEPADSLLSLPQARLQKSGHQKGRVLLPSAIIPRSSGCFAQIMESANPNRTGGGPRRL